MRTNLKHAIDNENFELDFHDAHIKAYQIENLAIEVVTFDEKGRQEGREIRPMNSVLTHKVLNI